MPEVVRFTLNGKPTAVTGDSNRKLLWVLRSDLGLTGTKYGCGRSHCGACTVLVDDKSVRSCHLATNQVEGKAVVTIEGLGAGGKLHPLQKAFMAHDALQCGFCTPGMIMNACGLLKQNPRPSADQIVEALEDNLCRCGAHKRIVEAVQAAAAEMRGEA